MTASPLFDFRLTRFERRVLLIAAAILAWQILIPPIVGLAENGDFPKIIRQFDLAAPVADPGDRWFKYAFTKYYFDPANHWYSGFVSTETLLVLAAVALNTLVSKDGAFDIRVIGVSHAAVFLLALALFLPALRRASRFHRVFLAGAVLLVFCDVMYVYFYNSFYMDTAGLLFFLLAVACFLRGFRMGFLLSCVLLVCAKPVFAVLGFPLAILTLRVTEPKRTALIHSGILILATIFGLSSAPAGYKEGTVFNVIFYRLLPGSSNPSRELRQLGLDDSYRRYIGTHTYSESSPMGDLDFIARFSARTSHARIAYFYARHPVRAFQVLLTGLDAASVQRPNMGTFDKSAGLGPYAGSKAFACWSEFKKTLFGHHPVIYLGYFFAMALGTGLVLARRQALRSDLAAGFYTLCAMAAIELLIGAMADTLEVERHMFPFNLCLDLLFLCACAAASRRRTIS